MSAPSPAASALALMLWTGAACAGPTVLRPSRPRATDGPTRLVLREGTALTFDLTPDGSGIVIDLLGQLWEVPAAGGPARPLTDGVGATADDRQPAVSPDGRWIATRSDRPGGRGIWVHANGGGEHRQVTDSATTTGSC